MLDNVLSLQLQSLGSRESDSLASHACTYAAKVAASPAMGLDGNE